VSDHKDIYQVLSKMKSSLDRRRKERTTNDTQNEDEDDGIPMIRKLLLDFIRPIWNNYQILKFFNTGETVATTTLSDKTSAFSYMCNRIAIVIHSLIGLSEFETCTIITSNSEEDVTFELPSESGILTILLLILLLLLSIDYQELISQRIEDHFHQKRRKRSTPSESSSTHTKSTKSKKKGLHKYYIILIIIILITTTFTYN